MNISNVAMTQFTSSAVVVYLMQKVKTATWFPLVQSGKAMLNRAVSLVAAFLVAVGVSWSWSKDPSSGTHTLTIMNLSWWSVVYGGWHWLNQYALQETIYQAAVNKPAVTTDAAGAVPAMIAPGGAVVVPPEPGK